MLFQLLRSHKPSRRFQSDFRTGHLMIWVALPMQLKYATLAAFQHRLWIVTKASDAGVMMQHWIAAAFGLPDTEDVRKSVVETLLQMAYDDELRPHIPVVAWEWLKKRPVLRREGPTISRRTSEGFFETVRNLGDIGVITSYLLLVWSEWNNLDDRDREEMQRLIREQLDGIHAAGYRADLVRRLDHILPQFDRGWESVYPPGYFTDDETFMRAKEWYEGFRRDLLQLDEETSKILAGTLPRAVTGFRLLMHMHVQDLVPPSCVLFQFLVHSYD